MSDFTEQTLTVKEIYKGAIIQVEHQQVRLSNGKTASRELIRHHGAVAILAVKENKVLLVRQYRKAIETHTLEIPAGKLDTSSEEPLKAAKRELEEETNFAADHWQLLLELVPTPAYCTEKIVLYQASDLKKIDHPAPLDEDEFLEILWLDIEEAYQKIFTGDITDAKTIIALQFAYHQHVRGSVWKSKDC